MKLVKILAVVALLAGAGRYFPVYYHTMQYNEFVGQVSQNAKDAGQLRRELMEKAEFYFIPIKTEDIQIVENGSAVKVDVAYRVPVNFFLFEHVLNFHASGAGNGIEYKLFGGQ